MRVPVSKLRRPHLDPYVIDRTWLLDRPPTSGPPPPGGAPGEEATVTLLSAPAGTGKTTLMAAWAASRAEQADPVGWLTLDPSDNDRSLFWGGLLAAVGSAAKADAGEAPVVAPDIDTADVLTPPPTVGLELLLARTPTPLWLFIDDLQEIRAPEVLADLDDLLRRPPDGLQLVLATRRDPAVALHRLRLSGRLREIRATDLALDRSEIRQVLAHHGVVLPETELGVLVERTGGWAAGVRLAAVTLSEVSDPGAVVRDSAGEDRLMADYLATEVLSRLGGRERHLLRLCAVPEQLTRDLAVVVTGDVAATAVLEKLYRDNVLLQGSGGPGGWYWMHALLRGYLLEELTRSQPELVTLGRRRAARWFAEQGHPAAAIAHAVQAADDALVVEVLARYGPGLLAEGRAAELRRLISLSSETARADLTVRRLAYLTAADQDRQPPVPVTHPRHPADEHPLPAPAGTAGQAPLETLVALEHARADLTTAAAVLEGTAAVTGHEDDDLELLLTMSRGLLLLMSGQADEADVALARAAALARASGNQNLLFRTSAYRTAAATARGQFPTAWDLADETVRMAPRARGRGTVELAGTVVLAAHCARQRLDHDAARRLAEWAGALLGDAAEVNTRISLRSLVAALDVEAGADPLDATRRLRDCWSLAAGTRISPPATAYLSFLEHRCAWLCGRADWAHEALLRLEDLLAPGGEVDVLTATEHLARGRFDAARRRLLPVLDGSTSCLTPVTLQQAWLIEALLATRADQPARVHEALQEAVRLADETGVLRPFLDLPGIAGLLDEDVSRFGRLDPVVERIRSAAAVELADHAFVPLTPRELAVLTDLPAQLTLEEIAARHHVSVNTVKTHVRSIYQKFRASNRRAAIATARRRGLL